MFEFWAEALSILINSLLSFLLPWNHCVKEPPWEWEPTRRKRPSWQTAWATHVRVRPSDSYSHSPSAKAVSSMVHPGGDQQKCHPAGPSPNYWPTKLWANKWLWLKHWKVLYWLGCPLWCSNQIWPQGGSSTSSQLEGFGYNQEHLKTLSPCNSRRARCRSVGTLVKPITWCAFKMTFFKYLFMHLVGRKRNYFSVNKYM